MRQRTTCFHNRKLAAPRNVRQAGQQAGFNFGIKHRLALAGLKSDMIINPFSGWWHRSSQRELARAARVSSDTVILFHVRVTRCFRLRLLVDLLI